MNNRIGAIVSKAVDIVFPRRCPICEEIVEQSHEENRKICPSCYAKIVFVEEQYCMKCGRRLRDTGKEVCHNCEGSAFSFEYGFVLMDYDELVAKSIASVKYRGKREYLDFYGEEAAKRLGAFLEDLHIEALIPVPVHKKRRRQRGYNQAEVLADIIGKELGIPVRTDIIKRVVNTKALKELSREERQKNLSEAMRPMGKFEDVDSVLLIDDILTTGATLESCSTALHQAGVKTVYTFALAAKPDILE